MGLEMADQKILFAEGNAELNPCGSDGWTQTPAVNHLPPVVFGMAACYAAPVGQMRKKLYNSVSVGSGCCLPL